MISVWHLLWIVPLCCILGLIMAAFMVAGRGIDLDWLPPIKDATAEIKVAEPIVKEIQ